MPLFIVILLYSGDKTNTYYPPKSKCYRDPTYMTCPNFGSSGIIMLVNNCQILDIFLLLHLLILVITLLKLFFFSIILFAVEFALQFHSIQIKKEILYTTFRYILGFLSSHQTTLHISLTNKYDRIFNLINQRILHQMMCYNV